MNSVDERAMARAVEVGKHSIPEDEKPHPRVGAVLVKGQTIVADAFRGEYGPGDHAEYTLFEKKLSAGVDLRGSVLFTTLEPCTARRQHTPRSEWIVRKGIGKVSIGMLDPNPKIYSRGVEYLLDHGIDIDFFALTHRRDFGLRK